MLGSASGSDEAPTAPSAAGGLVEGQLEQADDGAWTKFTQAFLQA
jgi:hypothetical protein